MKLNTIKTVKTDARIVFVGPAPSEGISFRAVKLAVKNPDRSIGMLLDNIMNDVLECDHEGQVDIDYSTYISADGRISRDAGNNVTFLSLRANKEALELYGKNKALKQIEFFIDEEPKNRRIVGYRLIGSIGQGGLQ